LFRKFCSGIQAPGGARPSPVGVALDFVRNGIGNRVDRNPPDAREME
jgi:hypothetical protein